MRECNAHPKAAERKQTVLHVISHMEKGGAEKQLQILAKNSFHINLLAVIEANIVESDLQVIPLKSTGMLDLYREIKSLIREHSVDIVMLWLPERVTYPALLAAKTCGCRTISADRRNPRGLGAGFIRDRLKYICHFFSDMIISNYPLPKKAFSIRKILRFPSKLRVILNAVDIDVREPLLLYRPNKILFVGRLVPQKNAHLLIGALKKIPPEIIGELHIVGDGPEKIKLEKIARDESLSERAIFHGQVTSWWSKFDPKGCLVVLPSSSEGMSNVAFEAIASGFPTIVSNSAEFKSLAKEINFLPTFLNDISETSIAAELARFTKQEATSINQKVKRSQSCLKQLTIARMVSSYDGIFKTVGSAQ
jgi:glycosyltransferase involved in cell wall biosynthesis